MEYLHAQGYPVPEVYESDGADLIMERLVGPTMLDAFPRRPWRLNQWAAMLAELHTRLEAVPVPSLDLPARSGPPQVLIHADLHPDNVMITDDGPIVIDWPNASIGPRGFDVASTWVLVTTSALEGSRILRAMQSTARTHFVKRFLADCDQKLARSLLPAAAQHRLEDRHLRPGEAEAIQALLAAQRPIS